ncbi:MAG TPA: mycofactocin-associated electron transfer flavoprotein alpha subunit [Pseudonocardiaceae bacterium]
MSALAVLVVRDGVLPLGAQDVIEEVAALGGGALLVGSGTDRAAGVFPAARQVEAGAFAAARWAGLLAPLVAPHSPVLLPASPDGRDLAPRLAFTLGRPLLAGAVRVTAGGAEVARHDTRQAVELAVTGPFVATLLPAGGRRGERVAADTAVARQRIAGGAADKDTDADPVTVAAQQIAGGGPEVEPATGGAQRITGSGVDVDVVAVLAAEAGSVELAEARRVFGAGAGLGHGELSGPDAVALLGEVAAALGATPGATRVVTDAGWADHRRQIGTTGTVVDPELYVAFGVSGAAQHTNGLGSPEHVVSVNTDPSCPMTAMAQLGIVADAQAVLRALATALGVRSGGGEPGCGTTDGPPAPGTAGRQGQDGDGSGT